MMDNMCACLRWVGGVGIWSILVLTGCVGPHEGDPSLNSPPQAALRAPIIAQVGEPVVFDASASLDPDGNSLSYVFDFDDATPLVTQTTPEAEHIFASSGLYTVRVHVFDGQGEASIAMQDVTLRHEYPAVPGFCEKDDDCTVGDECERGVCYANGGGIE